jgi:hypothetical protein
LVSCCPGLQSLSAAYIECVTGLLGSSQELTSLQTLHEGVRNSLDSLAGVTPVVCQLKVLRELQLYGPDL